MNSFINKIECAFNQLLRSKNPSFLGRALLFILRFPALLYEWVILLRNRFYDLGVLKSNKLPVGVVSIGNIAVGGTGKTPLLIKILSTFTGKGAVLTRGYRSEAEKNRCSVEILPTTSVAEGGDEALLLKKKFPALPIFSGPNRIESAHLALKKGVSLLFLEDGFQHRKVKRDLDIVVIDGNTLCANGWCLPAGLLREPLKALARAHYIVVMHPQQGVTEWLKNYTNAPVIGIEYTVSTPVTDQKVGLLSGIAQPQNFESDVRDLGLEIITHLTQKDHHAWHYSEIEEFALKCKDLEASCLLCTEKDWVKIENLGQLPLPIFPVKLELHVVFGLEHWKCLMIYLHQICNNIDNTI